MRPQACHGVPGVRAKRSVLTCGEFAIRLLAFAQGCPFVQKNGPENVPGAPKRALHTLNGRPDAISRSPQKFVRLSKICALGAGQLVTSQFALID